MRRGWRRMMGFDQTLAEREAYRQAMTLFFGALLGAQLGLLDALPARDFGVAILVLVAAVMVFQLIGHARSRRYALAQTAIIAALLGALYVRRAAFFPGLPEASVDKLFITLGVWLGAVLFIELTPIRAGERPLAAQQEAQR